MFCQNGNNTINNTISRYAERYILHIQINDVFTNKVSLRSYSNNLSEVRGGRPAFNIKTLIKGKETHKRSKNLEVY